jgi:hypothetical protein
MPMQITRARKANRRNGYGKESSNKANSVSGNQRRAKRDGKKRTGTEQ